MGTPWSNDGRCAGKKKTGLAIACSQVPAGHDDQVDAMVCEPAISIPANSSIADDEENCKEGVNGAAPSEENAAGWLPPTASSSNWMLNIVDGRFQSDFSSFISLLQGFRAGEESNFQEYRNFGVAAVVRFLEDKNAEIIKAASQEFSGLHTFYRSELAMQTSHHQQQLLDSESRLGGKIQELSCHLEKVSKELSDAQAQVSSTKSSLNTAQTELLDRKKAVQAIQAQLDDEKRQKQDASKSRDAIQKDMNAKRVEFEVKIRHSQEAGQAKDQEVQQLKSIIEDKERAVGNMEAVINQLASECQKLKAQLATIEQKSAQESLTSGSYADDYANPGMFVSACQSVDTATENLVKFLHERSFTSKNSLKTSPDLVIFIGKISRARPADFSRPAQVKHVWGHWICARMFQGFEHVFFDIGGERTSPLDFKKHALECFQSFQQKKDMSPSDYYKECDMFRAFCIKMYSLLFPLGLVNEVLQLDSLQIITRDSQGRCDGDGDLHSHFLEVAKAIWLLHELAFAFEPPASILRMAWGTPFDKQYHESLVKEDHDENSKVVLMLRPAFRVKQHHQEPGVPFEEITKLTYEHVGTSKKPEGHQVERTTV